MGGAGAIEIEGTDFTQALGLTDASGEEVSFTLGHNAIVEIDGQELYLNSNSYTLDGTTFSFNEDIALGETFTVGISAAKRASAILPQIASASISRRVCIWWPCSTRVSPQGWGPSTILWFAVPSKN